MSGRGGGKKSRARSYRTVTRLIAARGKTQFSSRARRARADQIWSRRARRPQKDRGRNRTRVHRAEGGEGRREFLEFYPQEKSFAFAVHASGRFGIQHGMEIRECAQRSAHIFNSFPLSLPGSSRARDAEARRDVSRREVRGGNARAHRFPFPSGFFFPSLRPSPVKPRRLFCLLRTLPNRV